MKTNQATIFEVFGKQIRYVVPLYQRPYVWKKDPQWINMWEDIQAKATEYLDPERQGRDFPRHFLGTVVLNPVLTSGFQVQTRLIVDGQQRLTTLQVILFALRDYGTTVGHVALLEDIIDKTRNDGRVEQEQERFKVWPTNADQSVFQSLYQAGSLENVNKKYPYVRQFNKHNPDPRHPLVEAYCYFYASIQKFAEDVNGPEGEMEGRLFHRMDALEQVFRNYLELVTIDLDERDNPQVIFESLNALGEPLAPSDLIRNFFFFEVDKQKLPMDEMYHRYWADYDLVDVGGKPNFWKQNESYGRYYFQRMDLYFLHYLTLRSERPIAVNQLYQAFTEWWRTEPRNASGELERLKSYSQIFKEFFPPYTRDRKGAFTSRVRSMGYGSIYPLLMYLFVDCADQLSPQELDGILQDLESFLIRRMVCDLTGQNYNNIFLSWLNSLRRAGNIDRAFIQSLMLQSSSDTARWPEDGEFREAWMTKPVYRRLQRRSRLVLEVIEEALHTSKTEDSHVDLSKTTLEHILPQAWHEHYPLPADLSPEDRMVTASKRDVILHTFGNLTIVTDPLNKSISNGPFEKKRAEITQSSVLVLNHYFSTLPVDLGWDESQIIRRGSLLFETALKLWPFPESK